jgi:phage protein D
MTLTIRDIEPARNNFYAPAFDIALGGDSLVRTHHLEVVSVQVDQVLGAAHRFSFVINNGFDLSRREFIRVGGKTLPDFFELGTEVTIRMGYGDRASLDVMLTGIVTEWSTSFPSSSLPQITISGYDHFYPLTKGTQSRNWPDRKDSDVVRILAKEYKLTPKVDDTGVKHPKIVQSQESVANFIAKLANNNGFEFFVTGKELYFRAPANDQSGAVELVWGRGLVSFSPEIKLSEQVTAVEVYGWDIQNKKAIVGRAKQGDEPGRDRTRPSGAARASGAQYLEKVSGKDPGTLRVREPVFSQQQADKRAKAILARRAEGFVGGRGESIGIPDLKPNANITLKGLGDLFSATFYIHQATHSVNSSGYRTTFEIKDTTI